jgi:type II secretory pathway component GspD/PulD (secretin)
MLFSGILVSLLLAGCSKKKGTLDPDFVLPKISIKPINRPSPNYPKGWFKKVSVNLGPSMSVKEAILQLSSKAKVNLSFDEVNDLTGISYVASGISFLKAIKHICRLCKWRVKIGPSGDITIKPDSSYFYNHEVSFLSNLRTMKSSNIIKTIVKKETDNLGMQLETENQINLWNEIEQNLAFMLQEGKSKYSINRQAGIIIVHGTQAEHEQIASFLNRLYLKISSQVLIEARIIEISLAEQHANGIDWNFANLLKADPMPSTSNIFSDLSQGITFLARFGDTKTLSNPRTTVLNNHHAVFKSVINKVYFKLKASYAPAPFLTFKQQQQGQMAAVQNTCSSEPQIVPIGIIFIVQPSIDFDNGSVTLHIRPTISKVDKFVADPAISILGGGTTSEVPVIEEKSIDSVITLRDREMAVVGGLLDKSDTGGMVGIDKGIFKLRSKSKANKEIVMLVQATIIKPGPRSILSCESCEILDPEEPVANKF